MNPPMSFTAAGVLDVDPEQIEAALRSLWQEASEQAEGPPVARVQVMNLIVAVEDPNGAALAEDVLALLPEQHPARVIVLEPARDPRALSASVSARCLADPSGARRICSEQIIVHAGREMRTVLVDALRPLVVPDLPVALWWTGRPRPADPLLRRFGAEMVDRVVLDSARFRDPGAGLIALARWNDDPRVRAALVDLAWERLRPWRHLLAHAVDPPEVRALLDALDAVTIRHGGRAVPPVEALLLAGWLAAALRWQPEDAPEDGSVTLRALHRAVTLRFEPHPAAAHPLDTVTLHAADGSRLTGSAADSSGLGRCRIEGIAETAVERVLPFAERSGTEVALAALGRPGRDSVYDAALAAAAEIALLGAAS